MESTETMEARETAAVAMRALCSPHAFPFMGCTLEDRFRDHRLSIA